MAEEFKYPVGDSDRTDARNRDSPSARGQTPRHYCTVFVETVVLSSAGGLLGVFVGLAIPWIVSVSSDIRTAVSLWSILLAFSIAVATGIVFGIYPARRAAMMDPIEALRHQ